MVDTGRFYSPNKARSAHSRDPALSPRAHVTNVYADERCWMHNYSMLGLRPGSSELAADWPGSGGGVPP